MGTYPLDMPSFFIIELTKSLSSRNTLPFLLTITSDSPVRNLKETVPSVYIPYIPLLTLPV